jgi:hypothetical protein
MASIERTLLQPSRSELEQALMEAVRPHGPGRRRILPWPPKEFDAFLSELETRTEGWHLWKGGSARRPQTSAVPGLLLLWWTDFSGRRHYRVLSQTRRSGGNLIQLVGALEDGKPPLAVLQPQRTFVISRRGTHAVFVGCDCGVFGRPEEVGWMGDCCGPCHDRRESRQAVPSDVRCFLAGHRSEAIRALTFNRDGTLLATGGYGGGAQVWEVAAGGEWMSLKPPGMNEGAISAVFSPDGRLLATGGSGTINVWELASGSRLRGIDTSGYLTSTLFSTDSQWVIACSNGQATLWQADTGNAVAILQNSEFGEFHTLALSPDGRTLAAGSVQGAMLLWDLHTRQERARWQESGDKVRSVAFAPDGRTVGIGVDRGGTIHALLWDVAKRRVRATLGSDHGSLIHVAFSADSRTLAMARGQRTVLLWDTATGEELATLDGHSHSVCRVAFSPDGSRLATGSDDGTVKLWPTSALRGA